MGLEEAIPVDGFMTTQLSRVINWARRSSVWPMPFATACCGIELMATASSRYDLARFGAEVFRFSPRQADLIDCRWQNYDQNDACTSKNLLADDRAQVGHFNGSMRLYRRFVRYVRSCTGRRSIPSIRRLRGLVVLQDRRCS